MPKAYDQSNETPAQTSAERGRVVRARLLGTAAELIGEIGWNAVTTRRLAERAGIRPGLVHYHFDSLQSLLRDAAMAEMRRVLAQFDIPSGDGVDVGDQADALISHLDVFDGTDRSSMLLVEAYLAATRDPLLRVQMREVVTSFRDTLSETLALAGNPSPDAAALVTLAALDGFILQKGLDPELSTGDAAALLSRIIHPNQEGKHL